MTYPEHPCVTCGVPTTNKTYCDIHLALFTKPAYAAHSKVYAYNDEPCNSGRRRENINHLR